MGITLLGELDTFWRISFDAETLVSLDNGTAQIFNGSAFASQTQVSREYPRRLSTDLQYTPPTI